MFYLSTFSDNLTNLTSNDLLTTKFSGKEGKSQYHLKMKINLDFHLYTFIIGRGRLRLRTGQRVAAARSRFRQKISNHNLLFSKLAYILCLFCSPECFTESISERTCYRVKEIILKTRLYKVTA